MAGRIDQIQSIYIAVLGLVGQTDGLAFYGDAPFAFDIHIVKELIFELSRGDETAELNHAISESGFPVIYVSYNTEVTYMFYHVGLS